MEDGHPWYRRWDNSTFKLFIHSTAYELIGKRNYYYERAQFYLKQRHNENPSLAKKVLQKGHGLQLAAVASNNVLLDDMACVSLINFSSFQTAHYLLPLWTFIKHDDTRSCTKYQSAVQFVPLCYSSSKSNTVVQNSRAPRRPGD